MQWWTHLWLNEGFASYIEYLAIDHLFPKWNIWTQFAHNDLGVALRLDSLKNTHPVEVFVRHPHEIDEIFNEVVYSKGASIIRMLASFLGEEKFKKGLRYYLKKHSYKNATTIDLWRAFEKVSNQPIANIMKNWISRSGYPLIKLTERKKDFLLTQSRFYSSRLIKKQSQDSALWQIPLKIQSSELKIQNLFFNNKTKTIPKPTTRWIKINAGENAFCRIDYPAQLLGKLITPIQNKTLKPIDRLGIIRDAFALTESGQLPTVQALKLAEAYKNENNYSVWMELTANLNQIANLMHSEDFYPFYRKYCQEIYQKIVKKLGWRGSSNEPHANKLLRSLVLYNSGAFGNETIVNYAQKIFKAVDITPDIRGIVYLLAAENGSLKEHSKLTKMYQQNNLHEEKNRIGRALGHFKDKKALETTLEFALSKHVRCQDAPLIIISVWSNYYGKNLAWSFVKKHWHELVKRYGEGSHLLQKMVKTASLFTTAADAKDISHFFKKHEIPTIKRTIEQVLEKINSNIAWLKSQKKAIGNWLIQQNQDEN
jgi:puromycin-sensitive aminopeptidase